jgi:hypothetical protein
MTEPTDEPPKPASPDVPSYPPPSSSDPPSSPAPAAAPGATPPATPPGAGYPAPPPMPYASQEPLPTAPRNGLGTAALVLGIIGVLTCWSVFGGIILGLVAVILGFIGHARVRRGEATNGGVSIAGIVLGFVAMIAGAVFIALYIWVFNFFGFTSLTDCLNKAGDDTTKQQQCEKEFEQGVSSKLSLTPSTTP